MLQLLNVWNRLDLRRQIVVVGATIAMFLAIVAMARMATSPTMTLLYSGLENGAAGEIVRALEQRGASYEVRGSSIFVDSARRDELRLTLASEGLPANSTKGYELLDSLSGFGTTSQMFDAAYWRAKEGELARTIISSPHIAMARVHVATTGSNPFQRDVTPKASVAVTPSGGAISPAQAKAIRFLVASAVSGLSPEDVAVIDSDGNMLGATEEAATSAASDEKAQVLRERVERLLAARVGFGNAVVEVSVDTVTESEAIRERRFDPEGRVAISTDTEERSNNSNEAGGGDVTVASNLPDGQAAGSDNSSSQNSEVRERINYEVSETEREIIKAPGAIKRLTVAVLVNDISQTAADGSTITAPRSEEELASREELVASAVGFDAARGDVITIKSMSLLSSPVRGTEASQSFFDGFALDVMSAIQMLVLAIVTLILGVFVVRPVLSANATASGGAAIGLPAPEADSTASLPDNFEASDLPDLSSDFSNSDAPLAGLPMVSAFDQPNFGMEAAADPVERLRQMIGERQQETVEILKDWLEEKQENV